MGAENVMPRFTLQRPQGPVYRDVLALAFRTAWHERRFWPLAFFASLLLTSGAYDVILRAAEQVSDYGLAFGPDASRVETVRAAFAVAIGPGSDLVGILSGLQAVIVVAIIFVALAALSCVCQAGLVYAIGASRRGLKTSVPDAFRVGGGAFWPVVALNALALSTIWILRFLAAFPLFLALDRSSSSIWLLYVVSFLVFIAISFIVSIVQIFALNALVLQGAPVGDAIVRGYMLFKKNWVVTVETALLLLVIAIGIGTLFLGVYLILLVPMFAAVVSAALLQSEILLYGAMGLGLALFFIGIFVVTSFLTQFQYATWTFLYRKLGEGGVLPKLHRWARAIAGTYGVR